MEALGAGTLRAAAITLPQRSVRRWFGAAVDSAPIALVLAVALALALPAILNGVVFLYPDSASYLAQGQAAVAAVFGVSDNVVMLPPALHAAAEAAAEPGDAPLVVGGRSIYYGLFAYVAYASSGGWLLLAVQALAVAWPLVLLTLRLLPTERARWVLPLIGFGLAMLTPAGLFVGLVMPDIWLPAMLLALAVLATKTSNGPAVMVGMTAIVAFAAMAHTSHLLVALSGLALMALAKIASRRSWSTLTAPMLAGSVGVVCAVAGGAAFSAMVERTYGAPPISRPHLTAHLIDLGPGMATIERACAEPGAEPSGDLAVCAAADRLPQPWTKFLFEPTEGVFEPATAAGKRALAEQDLRFALLTLRHAPFETVGGLAHDAMAQLWHVSVATVPTTATREDDLVHRFPDDLVARTQASRLYAWSDGPALLTRAGQATSVAAFLVLGAAGLSAVVARSKLPAPLVTAIAVLVAGVVLNASICGALASPYGRFQARLVWLLVVAAALLVAARPDLLRLPSLHSRKDAAS